MDIIKLLEGTIYEPDAERIDRVFKRRGVVDENSLRNAPALLQSYEICGHEVFSLLAEIRRVLSGEPKLSYTDEELAILEAKEAAEAESNAEESIRLDELSEEEE